MAIDAGTTGVRTLAVAEDGTVAETSYRELTQYFPRPGWVEHDPDEIWTSVETCVAEVAGRLADAGRAVAAVGITNQRETTLAWDRRTGRALHRAIVWQDRRTAARCEALTAAGHLEFVRATTGLVLDPYFSATKMGWLLDDVGVASDGADLALGTVDSWLLWHLTGGTDGGVFATDATNASRTLLFDLARLEWSPALCDLFGVPAAALAEVRPSCGRFGTVASSVAGGAIRGLPVSGIAGDQHAALFGQACFEPGTAKVTYGTGSFVLSNAGTAPPPVPDGIVATVAWDLGERGPVSYALEGSTFVSGAAIQWLRDGLGLIAEAAEMGPLAASVPDSGGVTVVPAFTGLGSPWWDPRARGVVTGLTRGAGRAQLARAVVEALAYQVRDMVEVMVAAAGAPISVLRADGGAAAMDLLLQLQADQIRTTVARPKVTEATALGAATLAGLAEGVWSSLDELAGLWQLDVQCEPLLDPVIADLGYAAWQRAVERSRGWAEE
jgi:glycerol kinase